MEAEKSVTGMGWKLSGSGKSQGIFDAVVIAHNGKCANRYVFGVCEHPLTSPFTDTTSWKPKY